MAMDTRRSWSPVLKVLVAILIQIAVGCLADCEESGLRLVQVAASYKNENIANEEVQSSSHWQGVRETGTTCMFHGCPSRFGSVECHHWRCVCQKGFRYYPIGDGTCVAEESAEARQFTNGTCFISECPRKFGLTRCVGHECLCLDGHEVQAGVCAKVH